MKISDFIDAGLTCPSCDANHIRGAYHDWHNMDAFICNDCGLRWREDQPSGESIIVSLKRKKRNGELDERFIWVLSTAGFPFNVILNPKSSDEVGLEEFVKDGQDNASETTIKGENNNEG